MAGAVVGSCTPRLVLLALVALGASCSTSRDEPVRASNLLFDQPARRWIRPHELFASEELSETRLDRAKLPPGWRLEGGRRSSAGACGTASGGELRLEGVLGALEATADELAIEIRGARRSQPRVEIRRADASGPYLTQELRWDDALDPAHRDFRISLRRAEPRELGDRLRISVPAEPARTPCVVRLRWLKERFDPLRLEDHLATPRRLEIDSEVRDALLQAPGSPIELTVPRDVRRGERLEVGFGVWGGVPTAGRVRITASGPHGLRPLLEVAIEPSDRPSWQQRAIELRESLNAGSRLELSVELTSRDLTRPVLLAWSDLRLRSTSATRGRPNLVLVSIDTLRADRMSLYGAARPTTPRLASWAAKHAAIFDQAIASAPTTLPSHTSLFSGLNANRHGVVYTDPAPEELELLAERLRAAGFVTQAITGSGFLDPRYGLDQGFERYRYWPPRGDPAEELEDGCRRAQHWLADSPDEPFFLFLHTYEVHGPYRARQPYFSTWSRAEDPPEVIPEPAPTERSPGADPPHRFVASSPGAPGSRRPLSPTEMPLAADLYDSGVATADELIGDLLDWLSQSDLDQRTIVVVTSDHGESLGEHDLAGHGFLYDDNLRVPLLIALPNAAGAGRRIAPQVRLVDLLPTLLDAVGLPPAEGVDGVSLLGLIRGESGRVPREALSYSSALGLSIRVASRSKLIYYDGTSADRQLRHRLFRVDRDPGEIENQFANSTDIPGLEALAFARLRDSTGLLVDLEADDQPEEMLRLSASWLSIDRLTWLSPPCARIEADADGAITIRIDPESACRLLVRATSLPVDPLELSRFANGRPREARSVDVRAVVASGRKLELTTDNAKTEPRGARVILSWSGSWSELRGDPARDDAELRAQLEALGYLR